jgi:L-asparaginase
MTTGGTIEKSYSEDDGSILNKESIFKERLLRRLRLPFTEIEVLEIMCKDSLDMTESDRETIAVALKEKLGSHDGIVVLHGTDTMEKTLKHCFSQIKNPKIPIVFTGAMRPAGFEDSDAQQNFTEALFAAQTCSPGLYISFHGTLFTAPNVTKDKTLKTFVKTV